MATFAKGILGGYSGKVGNVIGTSWKGKDVVRSLPTIRKNRVFTQTQLDQQEKFGLMIQFTKTMSSLLSTTFKAYGKGVSAINAAMSYNLQNAINSLVSPFNISYPLILVSRGVLPNTSQASATGIAGNKIQFNWANNAGIGKASDNDKVILVVHCPALNHTEYILGGKMRNELTQTMDLPLFSGETVETWLAFISESGTIVSNSMYTGFVNVTA
ncbi:MAG: DUF6266 family protein [Leadbetterella sp.]|nr:DUF6266 family protein [Leadbetterella sp.]